MHKAALQNADMGMQHHMGFVQQGSNNPTVTEERLHTAATSTAQRQQPVASCGTPTIRKPQLQLHLKAEGVHAPEAAACPLPDLSTTRTLVLGRVPPAWWATVGS
jgi:hypothetical protein